MIIDAHLDLAWNACEWNRDLSLPVAKIREMEQRDGRSATGDCMVSWHDIRRGGIGIVIATLLPRLCRPQNVLTQFRSREAAYASAKGQLAYYRALHKQGLIRLIVDRASLEAHIQDWHDRGQQAPIGTILSMEGSDSILSPEQLYEWFEDGLRLIGPAHFGESPYCYGTGTSGGLKKEGQLLLRTMEELGMILDVTHLCDQSFDEALDQFHGPVIASHHNCRTLVPGERQLSDCQIKHLIERKAVIGASFDNWMIKPDFQTGTSDPALVCMDDVAAHVDHICQLAGNTDHCGLGTDLDGGHGKESVPRDLETIADLRQFEHCLSRRGMTSSQVQQVMSENWIAYFRSHWQQVETPPSKREILPNCHEVL